MINLTTRMVPLTIDAVKQTVDAVLTTQNPAEVWSWERMDVVEEVLLMSGAEYPEQVPLLDSHSRWSAGDVLGSVRDIRVEGGALVGTLHFSKTPSAREAYTKVEEGHLTDISVGYKVMKSVWVPKEQKQRFGDVEVEGPKLVGVKWKMKESSICPIGADEMAKVRAEAQMNNTLREYLEGLGMKEGATSADAVAFMADLAEKHTTPLQDEKDRIKSIYEKTDAAGLDLSFARKHIEEGTDEKDFIDAVFKEIGKKQVPKQPAIEVGRDEADKFRAAAVDGMLVRSGQAVDNPSPGYDDFIGVDMSEVIRRCMVRGGSEKAKEVAGNKEQIATLAMRAGTMTGDDFPHIFSNVVNKTLMKAYKEFPSTWRPWVTVTTASDFKEIYGMSLSEAPALDLVNESEEYKFGNLSENREKYRLFKYGKMLPLTWEMIINDDLRAFTRIPQLFGSSAKRKESDLVYDLLLSNPTMGDGYALFHANSHKNFIAQGASGYAIPSEDSLTAGRLAMRLQKGMKGKPLDIMPRFLLAPVTQELTVDVLLRSTGNVASNKNAGVHNPMEGRFEAIVEPRLDHSGNTKGWYLIADPAQIDTFEVAYLNGHQTPLIDTMPVFERDVIYWKVRHVFGVGCMEWRSFYHNNGNA